METWGRAGIMPVCNFLIEVLGDTCIFDDRKFRIENILTATPKKGKFANGRKVAILISNLRILLLNLLSNPD